MTNNIAIFFSCITLFFCAVLTKIIKNLKLLKNIVLIFAILSLVGIVDLTFRYFKNIETSFLLFTLKSWSIFIVDSYALLMALTSIVVGILIILYSFDYMSHYERQNDYYFYVVLFIASMLGLVFSGNLIVMYIFWEITSVCSWQLISFYRKNIHLSKGNKAFLVTFLGSALMLVGIAMIYVEKGSFNFVDLRGQQISDTIALFLILGMIAKSAQLPFHIWLPDAGVAPTPVTALLHAAVLVKIGVYTFGRIFDFTFKVLPEFQQFEILVSIMTIIVAAFMALVETDIKRILAYSTISQLGYIFLGFAINVTSSIVGSIFYIVSHAFAKAGLFLSAGIVEHNTNERNINNLGGLAKTMPITAICFLICSFSIIGFPVFSGFWGKFFIVKGTIETNRTFLSLLLVLGTILTLLYSMRIYNSVFLGNKKFDIKEQSTMMVAVVVVLSLVSLILGFLPGIIFNLININ
ncbi:MAG: NADH-quinone oxidoreductase subunit L [Endomicrobia bacterium]|nr:NADH-quinone oxidoreductase subunit L [Endomicrobiia bacterium]